jgi:hypothetical protein
VGVGNCIRGKDLGNYLKRDSSVWTLLIHRYLCLLLWGSVLRSAWCSMSSPSSHSDQNTSLLPSLYDLTGFYCIFTFIQIALIFKLGTMDLWRLIGLSLGRYLEISWECFSFNAKFTNNISLGHHLKAPAWFQQLDDSSQWLNDVHVPTCDGSLQNL